MSPQGRIKSIEVFRVTAAAGGPGVTPVLDVVSPSLPPGPSRASAERLAARVVAGSGDPYLLEPLGSGGELIRAAAAVRNSAGRVTGAVVASDYLTGDLAARSRRMTAAYEDYRQLRVLKTPLFGVYVSFFLMVTLLILVGATWMGLYLAKRITRPVQMLAAAAREIGAGHLDHRVERETEDEFGALVEAFNSMAEELAGSRRKLERSAIDLERKTQEAEGRRRYIETILERIATGVVTVDADGSVATVNAAAGRLLGLGPDAVGQRAADLLARDDLAPLAAVLDAAGGPPAPGRPRRWRCCAKVAIFTWPSSPLRCRGKAPRPRVACSSSTMSRRSSGRRRWRPGVKWRAASRTRSRTR